MPQLSYVVWLTVSAALLPIFYIIQQDNTCHKAHITSYWFPEHHIEFIYQLFLFLPCRHKEMSMETHPECMPVRVSYPGSGRPPALVLL